MRVGIVAGEVSGDILGAGLMAALKKKVPDCSFEGIAGPLMIEQGATSKYSMERLALMGIAELAGRFTELLAMRNALVKYFLANPPDVFIGIDAPEFTLGIEKRLKQADIKTVHYVSPSVWAWRQYRVKKIARSTDLMLTLFPFEAEFYKNYHIPVKFVGHPLADDIPLVSDKNTAREELGLPEDKVIVAILPGSRSTELRYLGEDFVKTAQWCVKRHNNLHFVTPLINEKRRAEFENILNRQSENIPITLVSGNSRTVMAAADVVLIASGTATLEAMLLKRPMVAAYRISSVTYFLVKSFLNTKHFTLPNLLTGREVVPEFMQNDIFPEVLGKALLELIDNPKKIQEISGVFTEIHKSLRKDASKTAADAILELIQ